MKGTLYGMSLLATILMVVSKLQGRLDMPWWLIFAPWLLPVVIVSILAGIETHRQLRRLPPEPEDVLFTKQVWQNAVAKGLTTEGYNEYLRNRGRR